MRRACAALVFLTACTAEPTPLPTPIPGAITVAITPPVSIDPATVSGNDASGALVVRTMCEQLLRTDPRTGELRPGLARSFQVLDGGRRVLLRLRKDAGVRSQDVVTSLTRAAARDTAGPSAELLSPIDGYDVVHGDAEPPEDDPTPRLRGVRPIDATTVEITLREPQADWVHVLAHPIASVGSPCAGRYEVASRDPITLTAGGSQVVFTQHADRAAALNAGADVARVPVASIVATDATGPSPQMELIGLPSGTDPSLALALSLAIDRASVVQPPRTQATGFLPPSSGPVFRPDACARTVRFDPDDARRAMPALDAQLTLTFNDELGNRTLMEAVAASWRTVLGVEVTLVPKTWDDMLETGRSPRGFDGPFRLGWGTEHGGADAWLAPLYSSSGRANTMRYSSPDIDRTLERRARRATASEDRRESYRAAEEILCRELPAIPVAFGGTAWRFAPGVSRALDRTTGLPVL